ncbi:DUF1942 domain-containing protein [Gordonia crocea]|uniref:DUF1942 domain-containing protein n=1 Tax=Gordonia crocea TaxID=589162 RepID=UPI001379CA92|nr:DUF1942 domain-containing protein [Gordonia crocea]
MVGSLEWSSPLKSQSRAASLIAVVGLSLIALLAPTGRADAAPGRFISNYEDAGHVDISDIGMSGSIFSFVATITTSRGSLPVNPLYWSAKAADGTMYTSPNFSNTTLGTGSLPAGERARGVVAFEITGPRPTLVSYEGVFGDRLATWTIKWRTPKPAPRPRSPFGS